MLVDLGISFPSEVSRLERQVEIERDWTAAQRIAAVAQMLKAVRVLGLAGGQSAGPLEYHERCERQWQKRLKEFIAEHAGSATNR